MSYDPQPAKQQSSPPKKEAREEMVFTPISLARARHAGQQNMAAVQRACQTAAEQQTMASNPENQTHALISLPLLLNQSGGCLVVTLLGVAFMVGGALGGLIGGGLLLWANNNTNNNIALVQNTPTPTVAASSTPVPVETPLPTATPHPLQTPSAADVIEAAIPSVVTVINQQQNAFTSQLDEGRVVGSGVVIDSRGYIATNNHVVDHPGELKILLYDGRETLAELVAANPAEDLAILKIDISDLPAVVWGNSRVMRPGQVVYAIGSPLGDFPNSVSVGIVSGLNRALEIDTFVIDGLIQTDAAINRGSSGGPLITPDGKVVGINTFIIRESEERGIAEGIAFAIPAETAKNLLIPWIAAHTGESVPIPASEDSTN